MAKNRKRVWRILTHDGWRIGEYEGADETAALEAYAQDAGYRSYAHMQHSCAAPEPERVIRYISGFAVVRTAFHGGGVLSRHRKLARAEVAAERYRKLGNCCCGCARVIEMTHLRELSYAQDATYAGQAAL